MDQIRVRTQDQAVGRRPVPISHVTISGTATGTANTVYTVRTGVLLEVRRLVVSNITGTAATLTLHTIPSGGSIGDANAELKGFSVPANKAEDLTDLIGGLYAPGTVFSAYSGTANALVVHGWAEEVL